MAFNINSFKNEGLVYGGARPTLFEVTVTPPPALGITTPLNGLRFLARASQIPAFTVADIEVPYFGRKIKVSGDRTFADWSITVMNDEDFKIRAAFEAWSNRMNTVISNVNAAGSSPASYKATASVSQFSKAGKSGDVGTPLRTYRFEGLFPIQIDAINLDWDSTNQIETFDVTFAYDYWDIETNGTNATVVGTQLPGNGFSPNNPAVSGAERFGGIV
jgi:hypothetical protein